jgi:hypothetical protein
MQICAARDWYLRDFILLVRTTGRISSTSSARSPIFGRRKLAHSPADRRSCPSWARNRPLLIQSQAGTLSISLHITRTQATKNDHALGGRFVYSLLLSLTNRRWPERESNPPTRGFSGRCSRATADKARTQQPANQRLRSEVCCCPGWSAVRYSLGTVDHGSCLKRVARRGRAPGLTSWDESCPRYIRPCMWGNSYCCDRLERGEGRGDRAPNSGDKRSHRGDYHSHLLVVPIVLANKYGLQLEGSF